jgi:hypothetical protein
MGLNDLHGEPVSTSDRRSLDRFEHAADLLSGLFADPLAVIDEALEDTLVHGGRRARISSLVR